MQNGPFRRINPHSPAYLPSTRSYFELNTLSQRQVGAIVNGIGLAAHINFPGVGAGFAATAGFFFATKGATNFGT